MTRRRQATQPRKVKASANHGSGYLKVTGAYPVWEPTRPGNHNDEAWVFMADNVLASILDEFPELLPVFCVLCEQCRVTGTGDWSAGEALGTALVGLVRSDNPREFASSLSSSDTCSIILQTRAPSLKTSTREIIAPGAGHVDAIGSRRRDVFHDRLTWIAAKQESANQKTARDIESALHDLAGENLTAGEVGIRGATALHDALQIVNRAIACPKCKTPSELRVTQSADGELRFEFVHPDERGVTAKHAPATHLPSGLTVVGRNTSTSADQFGLSKTEIVALAEDGSDSELHSRFVTARQALGLDALQEAFEEFQTAIDAFSEANRTGWSKKAKQDKASRLNALADVLGAVFEVGHTGRLAVSGRNAGTFQVRAQDATGKRVAQGIGQGLPLLRLLPGRGLRERPALSRVEESPASRATLQELGLDEAAINKLSRGDNHQVLLERFAAAREHLSLRQIQPAFTAYQHAIGGVQLGAGPPLKPEEKRLVVQRLNDVARGLGAILVHGDASGLLALGGRDSSFFSLREPLTEGRKARRKNSLGRLLPLLGLRPGPPPRK